MPVSIQILAKADLEDAARILSSAFQRPGNWLNDLHLLHRLQPDGYFGAYVDGVLAGIVGSIIYPSFAYVGMMGVHQEFQRRGLGLALMQHLLRWLEVGNVTLVLLDASKAGQPLYEKLGFVAIDKVYTLQRKAGQSSYHYPPEIQPLLLDDLDVISSTDKNIFGTDRSRVLRALLEIYPNRAFGLRDDHRQINGYLIAQERRIGPWVMRDANAAESILRAALCLPFTDMITVAVPGMNSEAIALLKSNGFEIVRTNCHMGLGSGAPAGQRSSIFGQASLSLG